MPQLRRACAWTVSPQAVALLRSDLGGVAIDRQPAPPQGPAARWRNQVNRTGCPPTRNRSRWGIHLGADRPDHLAGIRNVDAAVDHHHELGVGELGQGRSRSTPPAFGWPGSLVDGRSRQLCTSASSAGKKSTIFRICWRRIRRMFIRSGSEAIAAFASLYRRGGR